MTIALAILAALAGSIGFLLGAAFAGRSITTACQRTYAQGFDTGYLRGISDQKETLR